MDKEEEIKLNSGKVNESGVHPIPVVRGVGRPRKRRCKDVKDYGWAWVVCFGSFVINFLADGILFSFGVLYLELLDYFGASKAVTAAVGSTTMGMHMLAGPLVSALVNRFGCRRVTITGSLLASFSIFVSTFSPNIYIMIVTLGFLTGLGIGMMYIPAIIIIGFYFERRRALANGLGMCGSGIGFFAYAPLTKYLFEIFYWKGGLIIIAGITLHGVISGAVYRTIEEDDEEDESDLTTKSRTLHLQTDGAPKPVDTFDTGLSGTEHPFSSLRSLNINNYPWDEKPHKNFLSNPQVNRVKMEHFNSSTPPNAPNSMVTLSQDRDNTEARTSGKKMLPKHNHRLSHSRRSLNSNSRLGPLYRKDIFYSGSIMNLKEYKESSSINSFKHSMSNLPLEESPEQVDSSTFKDVLVMMLDPVLFKNPVFVVLAISHFLWTAQTTPFTYIGDHAVHHGMNKQHAAFLLMCSGITSTISRVVMGLVADCQRVDPLKLYYCSLILQSIICMALPFCHTFEILIACALAFGFNAGSYVSLRTIVIVDLLGVGKLTNAFGWIAMFQGIGYIICPVITGSIHDVSGNFYAPFGLAAALFFLAGLVCFPLRHLARSRAKCNLCGELLTKCSGKCSEIATSETFSGGS